MPEIHPTGMAALGNMFDVHEYAKRQVEKYFVGYT